MSDPAFEDLADDLWSALLQHVEATRLPMAWSSEDRQMATVLSTMRRMDMRRGVPVSRVEALLATRLLLSLLARMQRDLVERSREDGESWSELGRVLGVSKQAAQQAHRRAQGR